jgi:DNA-binding MarR family transcriptional regulator
MHDCKETGGREDCVRQVHAATRAHEYTLQAVADFLGLHYSTVSMIAKRVARDGGHCKSRSDPEGP